jgi:hypothetical protein
MSGRPRTLATLAAGLLATAALAGLPVPAAAATADPPPPVCVTQSDGSQTCEQGITDLGGGLDAQGQAVRDAAAAGQDPSQVEAAGKATPPAQCHFARKVSAGPVHPDRFTSCIATGVYIIALVKNEVVGKERVEMWEWTNDEHGSGQGPQWNHGFVINSYEATGTMSAGMTIEYPSSCHSWGANLCKVVASGKPPGTLSALPPFSTVTNWSTERDAGAVGGGTKNSVDRVDRFLGTRITFTSAGFVGAFTMENPHGPFHPVSKKSTDVLAHRCDNVVGSGSGCVDELFTPTLALTLSRDGAAAAIIQYGQELSGHFGLKGKGAPLHRLTDSIVTGNNREVICDDTFTSDGGITQALQPYGDRDSCDEFSFAATYESGAMADGADGKPKPHVTSGSQCAQVKAVHTGTSGTNEAGDWNLVTVIGSPSGTEPCVRGHIPGKLNSLVGTAYSGLIGRDRLISKDPFWVSVSP